MSHKSGHIIITSKTSGDAAADVVSTSTVELEFPADMPIEDRIAQVKHVMKVMDKLDHEADED